jgi:NAD(P)-dependent dehydrogenase (short-subunit alcohol dehydrogenase family)
MNALTTALALELAPIRVNAVAPGVVRTPLWDAMAEADRQAMYDQAAQQLPLGRVGEVGDIAGLSVLHGAAVRHGHRAQGRRGHHPRVGQQPL